MTDSEYEICQLIPAGPDWYFVWADEDTEDAASASPVIAWALVRRRGDAPEDTFIMGMIVDEILGPTLASGYLGLGYMQNNTGHISTAWHDKAENVLKRRRAKDKQGVA